jgi:hypothetical protein
MFPLIFYAPSWASCSFPTYLRHQCIIPNSNPQLHAESHYTYPTSRKKGKVHPITGRFSPGKETRYPLYRRLGAPQGPSEWVRKISHPPRFDSPTIHSVASRYNDYAIPAHKHHEAINYHFLYSVKYVTDRKMFRIKNLDLTLIRLQYEVGHNL